MSVRFATATLVAIAAAGLASAPSAPASTLKRSAVVQPGEGFRPLLGARGERPLLRRAPGVRAAPARSRARRSLLMFGQLSDPQLLDETSPARKEYLASENDLSWRPHEALTTQAADQLVRAVNRHRTSELTGARGRRACMGFTLMTGDLTDNAQLNETRWYLRLLEGGTLDPSSGTAGCEVADPASRYFGVQDFDDFAAGVSAERLAGFWDPDRGGARGRYGGLRYPGLAERAQRPFVAEGLAMPWYSLLGNHEVLRQGFAPGAHPAFDDALATGCRKTFPSDAFGPAQLGARTQGEALERLASPEVLAQLERDSQPVLGDPARRIVGKAELKALHGEADRRHGFGFVDRGEQRRSAGSAAYYAWSPRPGLRMIALDTSAEGGRSQGNLDHPQYRWLARELDRNTSARIDSRGRVRRDGDPNRLIVVSGHHPLAGMTNGWADERSGACTAALRGGCDSDPRSSRPVHRGLGGPRSLLALLQRYPGVIAYVAGHEHRNRVTPYFRRDGRGGLWEILSASSIDFPGQARLIELMDNRDGTLSVFGTLVNHDAPLRPPPSGTPAAGMTETDLASLSRALAANGPVARFAASARGQRRDRNVELILRDPR